MLVTFGAELFRQAVAGTIGQLDQLQREVFKLGPILFRSDLIVIFYSLFQAVAIQQNINAVNDALGTLENLPVWRRLRRTVCNDLIQTASQMYNEVFNSPASSGVDHLAKDISSIHPSTSCSQGQKAAVIKLVMNALNKLDEDLENVRERIRDLGNKIEYKKKN